MLNSGWTLVSQVCTVYGHLAIFRAQIRRTGATIQQGEFQTIGTLNSGIPQWSPVFVYGMTYPLVPKWSHGRVEGNLNYLPQNSDIYVWSFFPL